MPAPRRPLRRPWIPVLACLALAGCAEVEEDWTFDAQGGGTYALTVRWDADLWRRVTDVLGAGTMARLHGRPFPFRADQWREGLQGLPGIEILELGEGTTDAGLREIRLRLRFADLPALLRWEVLARRTVRLEALQARHAESGDPPRVRFHMEPIARVPVLDHLGALVDAVERPPPPAEGVAAGRDPPPLERLGIDRGAAELVWRMVKQPLAEARLRFRVQTPGDLVEWQGRAHTTPPREARAEYDFAALRRPATDRTLDAVWQARAFDRFVAVSRTGDADPRDRLPDGRRR